MHVTGIIAEYNPFHNGHAWMIEAIRTSAPETSVLALMSGSFTQRGETAILDKWQRAEAAVAGGCDLVLELPFAFAVRSAQDFASGAVRLMERLGIVHRLAFGIEGNGNHLPALQEAAALIDTPEVQECLHAGIREGQSYAAALAAKLSACTGIHAALLKQPNTILALEYLRSLHLAESPMEPLPILRKGSAHHDSSLGKGIASASAIRKELEQPSPHWENLACVLPGISFCQLKKQSCHLPRAELFHRLILAKLCGMGYRQMREIQGINEGLEYRILSAAQESCSLSELLDRASSKRHPKSRIHRALACCLLGLTWAEAGEFDRRGPQYARVLAMNGRGRALLRAIREKSALPLITKTSRFASSKHLHQSPGELTLLQRMLRLDCIATDLREICVPGKGSIGKDFLRSPSCVE